MKIIQVTDVHLVPKERELFGLYPVERLRLCIEDINRHHADADLCVFTGDLTHFGDEESYALLGDELKFLTVPWQLLVGNHDNRQNFRRWFPEMPVDASGYVQTMWETAQGKFLFLDTLEHGTHAGAYCARRRAWLKEQLENTTDVPVFLFMHHPPMKTGIRSLDTIGLMQSEEFLQLLEPYREAIEHIFFGHVHRPMTGSWHGIPFSALRGTAHQCSLDFEAEDQPQGSHEPACYGVILIENGTTVVHFHDFMDESARFSFEERPAADQLSTRGCVANVDHKAA